MRAWRLVPPALVVLWLAWPVSPARADVHLAINNGQVSLSATNATVRQILAEWARVGHTTIVNGERVTGGPMTIELSNVSEIEALEVILRSVAGYVIAPRKLATPNASVFDRILIVPTSNAVRLTVPAQLAGSAFPQPQITPPGPQPDDDQDAPTAPRPGQPGASPDRPTFSAFPQPRMTTTNPAPEAPAAPTFAPATPAGVPVPGMVLPSPSPAQPGGQTAP